MEGIHRARRNTRQLNFRTNKEIFFLFHPIRGLTWSHKTQVFSYLKEVRGQIYGGPSAELHQWCHFSAKVGIAEEADWELEL